MKRAIRGLALAAAALASAVGVIDAASARPIVPAERRYSSYKADVQACDDPAVLRRITDRFHQKEAEYWNSSLEIVNYDRIQQIGFRTDGLDYIPRRYCRARAYVNDNKNREVVYSIGEDLGMIGVSFGVEWCVVGLDRNWAYGPACRAAYP
jgi:hypothetical protein